MLEKIAAARQLGARGLFSRLAWRARQSARVLLFSIWRQSRGQEFAEAALSDLQRLPVATYLPRFDDIRACYEQAPDGRAAADSTKRILAAADRICANKVSVRGSGELELSFESGNWYAYQPGAAIMLNRHDFLLPLVQAQVLEGHLLAGEKIRELFGFWIDNFDLARLRQCDTPIDTAIRLLNWAWVFNSDILRPESGQSKKLLNVIRLQVEYIYAWHSAGGNHLVLEALAAYVYGGAFPGGRVGRWASWGRRTLLAELLRQTTEDGIHTEQSMFYHQAVTTHYLKFFLTAEMRNDVIDQHFRDRFGLMLDYVHDTAKPSHGHPVLGDGEALVTNDREHWEARALLAARSRLFARPVYEKLVPMIDDSSVWLLKRWPAAVETTAGSPRSRLYEASGIAVFRDEDAYVLMDAAPFSDPEFPHHGHADALSIELCVGEDDLFIDPGGYGYYDDEFRRFFRSTAAHNTITVGDRDQSELFGVLGYGRLCDTTLVRCAIGDEYAAVVASHDGYRPALHQRSLILIRKPHPCLIIGDWLEHAEGQTVVSRLHAAPGCRLDLHAMHVMTARTNRAFAVALGASTAVTHRARCGERNGLLQGWVSPETHVAVPAVTWEATLEDVFDCAVVTLIALEPGVSVSADVLDQNLADLAIGSARYRLQRGESGFFLEPA